MNVPFKRKPHRVEINLGRLNCVCRTAFNVICKQAQCVAQRLRRYQISISDMNATDSSTSIFCFVYFLAVLHAFNERKRNYSHNPKIFTISKTHSCILLYSKNLIIFCLFLNTFSRWGRIQILCIERDRPVLSR